MRSADTLIIDLMDKDLRETALAELSRNTRSDLAPLVWNSSSCTATILLQEIISAYYFLSPPTLSLAQSHRVCNSLAIFQRVASHKDTRRLFVKAGMQNYLNSFLETHTPSEEFALLRLYSLGVIGQLVKDSDPELINLFLDLKLMALFLKAIHTGTEMSKRVATFIVQKILVDDVGLDYVCTSAYRLNAVTFALENVLSSLAVNPSPRLFVHVIKCYIELARDGRSLKTLSHLPSRLTDGNFGRYWQDPIARPEVLKLVVTIQKLLFARGMNNRQSMISHYRPFFWQL